MYAGATMDAWTDACIEQTGSQNVYEANGNRYFWETSREQPDGAITGKIMRFVGVDSCRPSGTFRIEPDGSIARAPKFLKDAAKNAQPRVPANALPGSGGAR